MVAIKRNASKRDLVWNYLSIFMAIATNLLLLPFLIRFLDADHLGLWYVYVSIGAIVQLFDFGFSPSIARNVAYCWGGAELLVSKGSCRGGEGTPNYKLLSDVLMGCKVLYLALACAAAMVLLPAGTWYISVIASRIIGVEVIASWLIYSFAVVVCLYFNYYTASLKGVGAVAEFNIANTASRFIQVALTIALLLVGGGILGASIAYFVYAIVFRLLSVYFFNRYSNLRTELKNASSGFSFNQVKNILMVMWPNAWRDGIVTFSTYLSTQACSLISSSFFSLAETGIFSISLQLATAVATVASARYVASQPFLQTAFIRRDKDTASRVMSKAMIVYIAVFIFLTILVILIGIPIITILKPSATFDIGVIIGLSCYMFLYKQHTLFASFISNTNSVPYFAAYIITSMVGICLSVVLIRFMGLGIWGLIIGQALPQLVYNAWRWPSRVFGMLNMTLCSFLKLGVAELSHWR